MKILKYVLIGIGVLLLIAGAGIAYLAATFDPNDYKPQIVQAVKERTQRDLKLEGNIELSFFPDIGARLGKATLSERGGDKRFATVEDLRVAVELMPLLSKQVVVDTVVVKGLRADLVRFKDGSTNFDDLTGDKAAPEKKPKEGGAPLAIDIDHVRVEDSAVSFTDRQTGARYEVADFNLKTGRIASGVPTDIELSSAVRSSEPKLDLRVNGNARVRFDQAAKRVALERVDVAAKGSAADVKNLSLAAKGNLEAILGKNAFSAAGLSLALSGKPEGGDLNIKINVPQLAVSQESVSGKDVAIDASIKQPKRSLVADIKIPAIQGDGRAFKATALAANIDLTQEGAALKGRFSSPVSGSLEGKRVELANVDAAFTYSDPKALKRAIEAKLGGAARLDWGRENVSMNLTAKLDQSTIKGKVGVAGFSSPAYTFDLDIDKLDVDSYLVEKKTESKGKAEPGPEEPFDLAALKDLRANGSVTIGSLKVSNVKASNVKLQVKAANGKVEASPVSANLYEGSLAGAVSVDARGAPVFGVRQKLTGVNVGPLLTDLADFDTLEGKANVSLDITTRGNAVSALKKNVGGTAALNVADGAIKGINIAQAIRGARAKLGALRGEEVRAADQTQKTDFTELKATFDIRDGVARNQDLTMKSPLLRVGGAGDINIGAEKMDYRLKATLVGTTKGQGGRGADELAGLTVPVKVSGTFAAPSYGIDFGAVVTDSVKEKVGETVRDKLQERLGGALGGGQAAPKDAPAGGAKEGTGGSPKGAIEDALKGLFGR